MAPWQKPWDPSKASLELPHNPTTEKAYRGGNVIHLLAVGLKHGHEDPRWMTYRQAQENGWQVRKGEKGTQIEFWQFPDRQERGGKSSEGKGAEAGADDERRGLVHRIYTVFNGAQIEGIAKYEPKVHQEWEVLTNQQANRHGSFKISDEKANPIELRVAHTGAFSRNDGASRPPRFERLRGGDLPQPSASETRVETNSQDRIDGIRPRA